MGGSVKFRVFVERLKWLFFRYRFIVDNSESAWGWLIIEANRAKVHH